MVKTNMLSNINRTLKVVVDDGREVTGRLLVYDHHMNVVLADATEVRPETKKSRAAGLTLERTLGLILLRGEHVVSVTVLKDAKGGGSGQEAEASFDKAPKSRKAAAKRDREEE